MHALVKNYISLKTCFPEVAFPRKLIRQKLHRLEFTFPQILIFQNLLLPEFAFGRN